MSSDPKIIGIKTYLFEKFQPEKRLPKILRVILGSVANFVFSIIYLDYVHINFAQLANIVTAIGRTSSRERFWRINLPVPRNNTTSKIGNDVTTLH